MAKIFDCPACHMQIGVTKEVGNVDLLFINDIPIRELRSFCPNCGSEIRYSVSDAALRALVEKVKRPIDV